MTTCSKCGQCCRAIRIAGCKKSYIKSGDGVFLHKHWHRINKKEAEKRVPGLTWGTSKQGYFYECDMFDSDHNACTCQEEKPRVCKDFPWYDREPNWGSIWTWPQCSYWEDIPESEDKTNCLQLMTRLDPKEIKAFKKQNGWRP